MVANFKVFKKISPNGKVTVYLGKRDYVDHVTAMEPIGEFFFKCSIFVWESLNKI